MKKFARFVFPAILLFIVSAGLNAEEFVYKYHAGDRYRILSTVQQDVFMNNRYHHSAEILNRIAVEVASASGGSGFLKAVFQTSERERERLGSPVTRRERGGFRWAREYESEFERDKLGYYIIDPKYYMPVVRDVPVFPDKNLQVGDRWTSEGHEVHDFRDNFGILEPYHIPFSASYTYLGEREWKGKSYPAFSVRYIINTRPRAVRGRVWPVRIAAESNQIVYWDLHLGQPVAYNETYRYRLELSNGHTIEYRGTAEAEIIESQHMDRERMAEEIAETIRSLGIHDVSVRVVDEGITLSLDNIQFYPDTSVMLPGEQEKLEGIVEILRRYQERDILVGGHTALAGTAETRQRLSTERASVVADYIINQNARTADRVVVRGYGAERPLADNSTEEGMRINRRVEITILEN